MHRFKKATWLDTTHRESIEAFRRGDIEIYVNDVYQVQVVKMEPKADGIPAMVWLSIKRRDRAPIHDWRDLQAIKNELVGPECEGVELYPAESRLVDTSNQYHLWVVADPDFRWPFGYQSREVLTPDELAQQEPKARQRPFAGGRWRWTPEGREKR